MSAVKIFQKGAFVNEDSLWGASAKSLAGDNAIPFLTLGKKKTVNLETDNSIDTQAFKDIPRKVTEYAEENISMYNRFSGLEPLMYWAWGFETVNSVVVLSLQDDPTLTPDDVYLDSSSNEFTFLRTEELKDKGVVYVFSADVAVVGTELTKELDTLTITENSGLMYEHVFELDRTERHVSDFKEDEKDVPGYYIGAKKNRLATVGVRVKPETDLIYPKSICKSFNFKTEAAAFSEWSFSFLSKDQLKGNFLSDNWNYASEVSSSDNIAIHHQMEVALGENEDNLVKLGVTSAELSVEIPLPVDQDTTSGLNIIEPVMEGKYNISLNTVLSRYSTDIYQGYRDTWQSCQVRISAMNDFYRTDIFAHKSKISEAGPDEGDIPKENLQFEVGSFGASTWPKSLKGNLLIQNSPIVLRVRNYNSTNSML